jgi:hypothetical protein
MSDTSTSPVSAKPVIFVSYSHRDEPEKPGPEDMAWMTFVLSFLAPVVKAGVFELWTDQHLHGGEVLDPAIKEKLAACDIFILLASRHSLASTYVVETEIATMRQRQADGDDVHIVPIVLSPVPDAALKQLKDLVLKPKDAKPLSLMSKNDRELAMAGIADDIAAVAEQVGARKREAVERATTERTAARETVAEAEAAVSPDGSKRQLVDIAHLPETAYERLVGRDAELKRLDDAWADAKTNILSLVAEGGAGKSALVNEWLKRLQAGNYRGAEAVLGWSFYSQGTKERATAAEQFLNWALDRLGIRLATTSATAKGEAIAEEMMRRRVLLVLDGVEPLQHGPGPQAGQLKDQGLRALLRRFATPPPGEAQGLVVLTSRLKVADIARWKDGAAPMVDVERLSDEAGAALLRDNGVWGTDRELNAAARDFGGHPLALGLLASFLKETQTGDVRRRGQVSALVRDEDNPRHGHAKRVMESYEKEWLAGEPVLRAIMHMVGLFDRPASGDCLAALRAAPAIAGLTDPIVGVDEGACSVPSGGCARFGCWRRRTRPRPRRSMPIRWCASGSASGCGSRTRRPGRPPTAGSSSTCATRQRKATRRRSKTSRRSTRRLPTAAAPAGTRRRSIGFTQTASAGGSPMAKSNSMPAASSAPSAATSRRSPGSSTSPTRRRSPR